MEFEIPQQRIHDLFNKIIDEYLSMNLKEIPGMIVKSEIKFTGLVHYDEKFLWIKLIGH